MNNYKELPEYNQLIKYIELLKNKYLSIDKDLKLRKEKNRLLIDLYKKYSKKILSKWNEIKEKYGQLMEDDMFEYMLSAYDIKDIDIEKINYTIDSNNIECIEIDLCIKDKNGHITFRNFLITLENVLNYENNYIARINEAIVKRYKWDIDTIKDFSIRIKEIEKFTDKELNYIYDNNLIIS